MILLIFPLLIYFCIILGMFAGDYSNICIYNVNIVKKDDKKDDCDGTVIMIMLMIK